jgi:hypothetical protein
LHSEESKQVCTGDITHRTTGVLKVLLPGGRHAINESVVQLILSEREIIARLPVHVTIKFL